jgi:hypothetical protein
LPIFGGISQEFADFPGMRFLRISRKFPGISRIPAASRIL